MDKEQESLVLNNLGLVRYVLQKRMKVSTHHPKYEDYYQEGVVGLIKAVKNFDSEKGVTFATYAVPSIQGQILRYKRDYDTPLKYGRGLQDTLSRVRKLSALGYSQEEIKEELNLTWEDMRDVSNVSFFSDLDGEVKINSDDSVKLGDMIPSKRNDVEERMSEEWCIEAIHIVADKIPTNHPKYRSIWLEYIYSIMYGEKLTQDYLGEKYGYGQVHISRLLRSWKNQLAELLEKG